jgi:hypothetical protein
MQFNKMFFLLAVLIMTNPTFARLPAEKCKLMLDSNNPTCFYSKIGEGHNQFGVYCLPTEFMSIICPCGIIKNSYTAIKNHLKLCITYDNFSNDDDDAVAVADAVADADADADADAIDGESHLQSISFKTYREAANNPKVGWYAGKLYLYYHHRYTYVCPCGHSATTKVKNAGYHNLGTAHFAACRKSRSDDKCCDFINNILNPSTATSSCFEASAADFAVNQKRKKSTTRKKTTAPAAKKLKIDDDVPVSDLNSSFVQKTVLASLTPPTRSQFPLGRPYIPYLDSSVRMFCPIQSSTSEQDVLDKIQSCFQDNYDDIVRLLSKRSNAKLVNWNATRIQSERYMIGIVEADTKTCWSTIVDKYLDPSITKTLLQMAKKGSMKTEYSLKGSEIDLSQFYIIFARNQCDQEPHIDLYPPNRQFSMSVTPKETSTYFFNNSSVGEEYRLTSVSRLVKFLYKISLDGFYKYSPDIEKIINADPSIAEKINKFNLGTLFNICAPDFIPTQSPSIQKFFQCTVTSVKNSPAGTVSQLNGGVPHSGAASSGPNVVRAVLFWQGSFPNEDPYEGDTQDTKVSLIVEIAVPNWRSIAVKTRSVLLSFIYSSLLMSSTNYRDSITDHYTNYPTFVKFLHQLNKTAPYPASIPGVKRIINTYSKITGLFIEDPS